MRIFKSKTLEQIVQTDDFKTGEVIICKHTDYKTEFQIYLQRIKGVYMPCGSTSDLKMAIAIGNKLETPTMIENGYQILSLDFSKKMIVYQSHIEDEIEQYIESTEQLSEKAFAIGDSGFSICFITPKEIGLKTKNRLMIHSEMVHFGNYLLSDNRRQLYSAHPVFGTKDLEERLSQVNHVDVENFEAWRRSSDGKVVIPPSYMGKTKNRKQEMKTCSNMMKMCQESLSPETFKKWDDVMDELVKNRKGLRGN